MLLLNNMSFIEIKYDLEKDIQNYEYSLISKRIPDYGRTKLDPSFYLWPSVKNKILEAKENEKTEIIKKYLKDNFYNTEAIELSIESLTKYWNTIEFDYFDNLSKYLGINKTIPKMSAYFTTLSICPYNFKQNYFYIPFFDGIAIQSKAIMHESMHIVFRQNFENYMSKKGVDEQSILEITEAIVILLNWEFKKFLLLPECNNKPSTKDLQDEVIDLYRKKKAFNEILDRLIEMRV